MTKAENLQDLEYLGHIQLCLELAIKWKKMKPDNPEIKALSGALMEIAFYNTRYDKNKAKLELEELKEKYNKMKKLDLK